MGLKNFSMAEHGTWRSLFSSQAPNREKQVVKSFSDGLAALGIGPERIPNLDLVNRRLIERTGFRGIPVEGLEEPVAFFELLAHREFPVGNFIRSPEDLEYTPAPDVFHDLYGHLPFLADPSYADFCEEFGKRAYALAHNPDLVKQFERLFWFTIEFGLIKTKEGLRIFGAGIASSHAECAYVFSGKPKIQAFDLEQIRHRNYEIDHFQETLFLLDSTAQLWECLNDLESAFWQSSSYQVVS